MYLGVYACIFHSVIKETSVEQLNFINSADYLIAFAVSYDRTTHFKAVYLFFYDDFIIVLKRQL